MLGPNGKPIVRKLFIAVPNKGTVSSATATYIAAMVGTSGSANCRVTLFYTPGRNEPQDAHSEIVECFLRSDCDWLLKLDADVAPCKPIYDLLDLSKPVIGLPAPRWSPQTVPPFQWMTWDLGHEGELITHKPQEGLQKVDAVGGCCLLIRRPVLEQMKAPFASIWKPNGRRERGWDMAFCQRCREAGIDIYTHYDYPCSHLSTIDVSVLAMRWAEREKELTSRETVQISE